MECIVTILLRYCAVTLLLLYTYKRTCHNNNNKKEINRVVFFAVVQSKLFSLLSSTDSISTLENRRQNKNQEFRESHLVKTAAARCQNEINQCRRQVRVFLPWRAVLNWSLSSATAGSPLAGCKLLAGNA